MSCASRGGPEVVTRCESRRSIIGKAISATLPKRVLHTIILALTCLALTLGGEQATAAREHRVKYLHGVWNTENGLPQNSVTAILQSHDGYLWIGTFGGL